MFQSPVSSSQELPPKQLLIRILDKPALVYVFLWGRKDGLFQVTLEWSEIRKFFNKNSFMSSVRILGNKGLVFFEEKESFVFIELMSWQDIDE